MDGVIAEPGADRPYPYAGTFTTLNRQSDGPRYKVEGEFAASPRALSVPVYRAEFGSPSDPYVVSGDVELGGGAAPKYALKVRGTQVTLPTDNGAANARAGGPRSAVDRLTAMQAVLAAIPLPPIPGSIDVELPAIIAGDAAVRDIRLKASPDEAAGGDGRGWRITDLSAQLPGRTEVKAAGIARLPSGDEDAGAGDGFAFDGDILLASRQPSGFATWLTGSADEAIRQLDNAGFAARVSLRGDRQVIDDIEVIADEARLHGRVERESDPTRRSTLDIVLTGRETDYRTLQAMSAVFVGDDGAQRFADHNLDLEVDLVQPDFDGIRPERLNASLRARPEGIEIDSFSVSGLFGASLSATASLSQGSEERVAEINTTVVAPDGAELILGLRTRYPDNAVLKSFGTIAARSPSAFAETRLDVVGTARLASGLAGEASLSVSGRSANTNISVTTTANGALTDSEKAYVFVNGSFDNHVAETLLAQAGVSGLPTDGLGPLTVEVTANGSLFDGMRSNLSAEGDDMYAVLDGVMTADMLSTGFTGTAAIEARDIEPWMMAFGYGLPGMGLGTETDFAAAVSYRRGKAVLRDISAILDGNGVSGDVSVSLEGGDPLVRGDLAFDFLQAGRFYGVLTGDPSVGADLVSPDPEAPARLFGDPLLAGYDIEVGLTAKEVALPAGDEPLTAFSTAFTYKNNAMVFSDMAGQYAGGSISGSAELQSSAGALLVNAQLEAEDAQSIRILPVTGAVAEGEADLRLQLSGSGRSTEALLNTLSGSGVLSLNRLTVAGLRTDGFEAMVEGADAIGYEITPAQIEALAEAAFMGGEAEFVAADYPITMASGEMRVTNATAAVGRLSAATDLAVDLLTGSITGDTRLTYDAGAEAVAGPQPEVSLTFATNAAGATGMTADYSAVTGYLTQRALEREQRRVEALQARLLEKQRLRREVRYFRALRAAREAEREQAPADGVDGAAEEEQQAAGTEVRPLGGGEGPVRQ